MIVGLILLVFIVVIVVCCLSIVVDIFLSLFLKVLNVVFLVVMMYIGWVRFVMILLSEKYIKNWLGIDENYNEDFMSMW